jgi:hypothetical protein
VLQVSVCDSGIGTRNVPTVVSVVHAKTTTTPVDPFDAQNNIELPTVVGQNSNSVANGGTTEQ